MLSRAGTTSFLEVTFDRPLPALTRVPSRGFLPLLLSVPHSGRDYPAWLGAAAWAGRASLEPLEDPLVDRLAWRALAAGHGAVIARAPRAAIDCNRAEDELDPALVEGVPAAPAGSRARAGLGLMPSRTAQHGPLWRRTIDRAEVERRLDAVHRPFHEAIECALAELAERHGGAILLDLHSMPPRRARPHAQIVIGDRHGQSARDWVASLASGIARERGFSVARNEPFAGGHIVARHGRPSANIHALQLEVDRSAYCLRDCRTPGPGFERVALLIEALANGLGEAMADNLSIAAE